MNRRRRTLLILAVPLCCAAALVGVDLAGAQSGPPPVTLSPTSGPAGSSFTVALPAPCTVPSNRPTNPDALTVTMSYVYAFGIFGPNGTGWSAPKLFRQSGCPPHQRPLRSTQRNPGRPLPRLGDVLCELVTPGAHVWRRLLHGYGSDLANDHGEPDVGSTGFDSRGLRGLLTRTRSTAERSLCDRGVLDGSEHQCHLLH